MRNNNRVDVPQNNLNVQRPISQQSFSSMPTDPYDRTDYINQKLHVFQRQHEMKDAPAFLEKMERVSGLKDAELKAAQLKARQGQHEGLSKKLPPINPQNIEPKQTLYSSSRHLQQADVYRQKQIEEARNREKMIQAEDKRYQQKNQQKFLEKNPNLVNFNSLDTGHDPEAKVKNNNARKIHESTMSELKRAFESEHSKIIQKHSNRISQMTPEQRQLYDGELQALRDKHKELRNTESNRYYKPYIDKKEAETAYEKEAPYNISVQRAKNDAGFAFGLPSNWGGLTEAAQENQHQ